MHSKSFPALKSATKKLLYSRRFMICPPVLPFRKQNSIELNHCIRDSMPITPDGSAHQDASLNAGLKLVQETDQGYQNLRFERLIGEEKLQSTGHLRVTMFAWPTTSPTWYGVNFLPYECDSIRTRWHIISHLEFGCPVLLYWLLVWNVQAHACVSFCVLYSRVKGALYSFHTENPIDSIRAVLRNLYHLHTTANLFTKFRSIPTM